MSGSFNGTAIFLNGNNFRIFVFNSLFENNTIVDNYYGGSIYVKGSLTSIIVINKICVYNNKADDCAFGYFENINTSVSYCSIVKSESNRFCLSIYSRGYQEISNTNSSNNVAINANNIFHYYATDVYDSFLSINNNIGKWIYGSNSDSTNQVFQSINIINTTYSEDTSILHYNCETSKITLLNLMVAKYGNMEPFYFRVNSVMLNNVWTDQYFNISAQFLGSLIIGKRLPFPNHFYSSWMCENDIPVIKFTQRNNYNFAYAFLLFVVNHYHFL